MNRRDLQAPLRAHDVRARAEPLLAGGARPRALPAHVARRGGEVRRRAAALDGADTYYLLYDITYYYLYIPL